MSYDHIYQFALIFCPNKLFKKEIKYYIACISFKYFLIKTDI